MRTALGWLAAISASTRTARASHDMFQDDGNVHLPKTWEALGPFPIGTREWPVSPEMWRETFHRLKFDEATYSSSLVDGGSAGWQLLQPDEEGWVLASHPEVRWDYLRGSAGWGALQYQTWLRGTLCLEGSAKRLAVTLIEGSEFAIFDPSAPPERLDWYQGDTYSYARSLDDAESHVLGHIIDVPEGASDLMILVRALYDLRAKGDPHDTSTDPSETRPPIARFSLRVAIVHENAALQLIRSHTHLPDLSIQCAEDGGCLLASDLVGVTVRNWATEPFDITSVATSGPVGARLLYGPIRLAAGQIRPLAIVLDAQIQECRGSMLRLGIRGVRSSGQNVQVSASFRFSKAEDGKPFRYTFLDADHSVQYAMAMPPRTPLAPLPATSGFTLQGSQIDAVGGLPPPKAPILVALHGAGVEASSPWWMRSIPQQNHSWLIFPTGKTTWGYDWHGPSLRNVEKAIEAVVMVHERWVSRKEGEWHQPNTDDLVVLGHSNGGQGAWYLASRYPDRVRALVPAAAYVKIQDYVSYSQWQLPHIVDPALSSLLLSSLAPYDNDLHTTNLFEKPILARHGAVDTNVPVFHSRVLAGLTQQWGGRRSRTTYEEVEGKDHWFTGVFKSPSVRRFLEEHSATGNTLPVWPQTDIDPERLYDTFTLTVSNPRESGSLRGFKVLQVTDPARIGRLKIRMWTDGKVQVATSGVTAFVVPESISVTALHVDGIPFDLVSTTQTAHTDSVIAKREHGTWEYAPSSSIVGQRTSPITAILDGSGPLILVYPPSSRSATRLANSLAEDLYLYFNLNVALFSDHEALDPATARQIAQSNVVIIGSPLDNAFFRTFEGQMATPVIYQAPGTFTVGSRIFSEPGFGLLYQSPHPFSLDRVALVLVGTDSRGLEKARRMFPLRAGLPAPDWMTMGQDWEDSGIMAAGFWTPRWKLGTSYV